MHTADREEFDKQLNALCAGYDKPVGDRGDAYWRGLAKMDLPTFARVVEFALGEGGPEKIPTTGQCWQISKQLRARPRVFEHDRPAAAVGQPAVRLGLVEHDQVLAALFVEGHAASSWRCPAISSSMRSSAFAMSSSQHRIW